MTDDGAAGTTASQDSRSGPILAVALLLLFGSLMLTTYLFHRHPAIFRELGMNELPFATSACVWLIEFLKIWWWAAGVLAVLAAAFLCVSPLGRMGWKPVAAVLILALATPFVAHFFLQMPLITLQRQLEGRSSP